MRINDGSICESCKHFEHECNYIEELEDTYCHEICRHKNKFDHFDEYEIILECEGFEREQLWKNLE